MQKSFLVTYAGKYGSTREIAESLGELIRGHGAAADVLPCSAVTTLEDYGAVLIGSAVRFGAWMKEAVDFVKANHQHLAALPAAIFSVHILNRGGQEEHRAARAAYTAPIHSLITARAEAFFPGVIDKDN
ncbi:MAG: flavodoxin domain-containing protein [Anaerolineaceae bacterium]